MLSLTRKTDYAIIALSHMAENDGRVCAAREIAETFHVPSALLMNVLKTLCRQSLVTSSRGAKGGYRLARSAAQISLSDIICAVEGPVHFVQCTERTDGSAVRCDLTEVCPVRKPVLQIHRRLNEFLREITLDQIVTDARAGRGLDELAACDAVACNVPAEAGDLTRANGDIE